ncbi:MAG: hypothetical protein ABEJ69_02960 [Candidatus Nanohaloarchaea archaeon]
MTEEDIGFHKGSVQTLLHEKKELSRLLNIVNSQLKRHLNALDEKGVDTEEFIERVKQGGQEQERQRSSRERSRDTSREDNSSRGPGDKDFNPL